MTLRLSAKVLRSRLGDVAWMAVVVGYLFLLSQGIPFWDDDYTSWFRRISGKSVPQLLWECVSPIAQDTKNWAFNERPVEALAYKLSFLLLGYQSWLLLAFKGLALLGCFVLINRWAQRLVPDLPGAKWVSRSAALLFITAPGPLASFILIQDFAPISGFLVLLISLWIWDEIQKIPEQSRFKMAALGNNWALIALVTVIGYRCKADLKVIPLVLFLSISM